MSAGGGLGAGGDLGLRACAERKLRLPMEGLSQGLWRCVREVG